MSEYTIYVRDKNLDYVAQVDNYQSLELILRFNAVSRWVLELPADGASAAALIQQGAGIVVERNDVPLLSGPLGLPERVWNRGGYRLTAAGPDDTVWLARRLALPVPGGPPYAASAYDVRTDKAETIMKQYTNLNAGPGANAQRQVPGLTIEADTALGATITGRARFDNLLELLASLALAGGDLGVRIVQSGAGIEFQVYDPSDLTASVVFSPELGNLDEFRYSREVAEANYVVCGGGGEGTLRTFEEKGDSDSIVEWGRIEMFRDRRDTSDTTEMTQAIDEELASRAARAMLAVSPLDMPNMAFGTDYNLGDKVTVEVDGTPIQDVLREVRVLLRPDQGIVVEPVVGTPGATADPVRQIFERMRRLGTRIVNLERR